MHAAYAMTLWHYFAIFLLASSLLGAVLGLLLMFRQEMFQDISRVANRWISTVHLERMLDCSISLERWFHRNHRAVGMFIVLGALYILAYFGLHFDKAGVLRHLGAVLPVALLDALVPAALLGAALALCAGCVLWLRPELLGGIEAYANRWISAQRVSELLDARYHHLDELAQRYARPTGLLLLVASVWLFFLMLRVLL